VVERNLIAFNVGARDVSVTMAGPDYQSLEQPTLGRFARRETSPPEGAIHCARMRSARAGVRLRW